MADFDRLFYPKKYREDYLKSLTPEEAGKYLAEKSLKNIKKHLSQTIL